MLLLIFSPNLISLLLGWDGLGVTSYLLVIYFQSTKSYNAGLLTALTNRVGDVLILFAIAFRLTLGRWNVIVWSKDLSSAALSFTAVAITLAAITKRAQIPFSAWLPAAIAAPTPVSSLVHSSTLVTAGVYLLFRFNDFIALRPISDFILWVGTCTIVIAGASALYELDMKKIVALSTLRQLGLIMATLGLGLYEVAFFHLITHAFFKALLFIAVGNIIHLSRDFQDLRKINLTEACFPTTLAFSLVANWRLCGLPFLAGFYSKDLILELMLLSGVNLALSLLFFIAVGLTVAYTARFIVLTVLGSLIRSASISGEDNRPLMNSSISLLWPMAITSGAILSWLLYPSPWRIALPLELKNLTLVLILIVGFLLTFVSVNLLKTKSSAPKWSWGRIWTLPFTRAYILNLSQLRAAKWARKLDLSWLPSLTLSSYGAVGYSIGANQTGRYKTFCAAFTVIFLSLFVAAYIYLRILKLLNT